MEIREDLIDPVIEKLDATRPRDNDLQSEWADVERETRMKVNEIIDALNKGREIG